MINSWKKIAARQSFFAHSVDCFITAVGKCEQLQFRAWSARPRSRDSSIPLEYSGLPRQPKFTHIFLPTPTPARAAGLSVNLPSAVPLSTDAVEDNLSVSVSGRFAVT
jgi:hypothetical protein